MPKYSQSCTRHALTGGGLGLAASSAALDGACIPVQQSLSRNANQWREIAYFLSGFEKLGAQRLEGPRVSGGAAGRAAPASPAIIFGGCVDTETAQGPDGNHGDNFAQGTAV